ncbi:MAG: hypothetical protein IPJ15_15225 [Actinomycetales bacterium]|nr:hypothetical protein [Candidatus Phosphoribacter baldrii]
MTFDSAVGRPQLGHREGGEVGDARVSTSVLQESSSSTKRMYAAPPDPRP